jgi:glutamate-5-semialdehyde dehydrogenase
MNALNVTEYTHTLGLQAKTASALMARAPAAIKNKALKALARLLRESTAALQIDNARDLERARAAGLAEPMVDRLQLSPKVLETCAQGCEQLAAMPDVIGEIMGMKQQPSGIRVGQMRVPIGVFGMIYESRPNVTIEAASLSIKSGNACILRGGSEAIESNKALARLVQQALAEAGLPQDAVQLVQTTDREAVGQLIAMPQYVDVIIPRGGKGLIERISRDAKVPVIKHLDGNCHTYVDDPCDIAMAVKVADNAKTSKYSPCNASEGLLVARGVAARVLAPDRRHLCRQGRGDARLPRVAGDSCSQWQGAQLVACYRAGLVRRIPGPHHQREGGGRCGRGHRPHQPLFQPPHRRHPHHQPPARPAFFARGGLGQRDGERQHAVC